MHCNYLWMGTAVVLLYNCRIWRIKSEGNGENLQITAIIVVYLSTPADYTILSMSTLLSWKNQYCAIRPANLMVLYCPASTKVTLYKLAVNIHLPTSCSILSNLNYHRPRYTEELGPTRKKPDDAMPCTVQVKYYQTIFMRLSMLIIGDYYCTVMSCSL